MTKEHEEILKRLTDNKSRKILERKTELVTQAKMLDENLCAYWDGVYDALKEVEKADADRSD